MGVGSNMKSTKTMVFDEVEIWSLIALLLLCTGATIVMSTIQAPPPPPNSNGISQQPKLELPPPPPPTPPPLHAIPPPIPPIGNGPPPPPTSKPSEPASIPVWKLKREVRFIPLSFADKKEEQKRLREKKKIEASIKLFPDDIHNTDWSHFTYFRFFFVFLLLSHGFQAL